MHLQVPGCGVWWLWGCDALSGLRTGGIFVRRCTYKDNLSSPPPTRYGPALKNIAEIIERGVREHPELSVGSNTEGVEVRSVGNSQVLRETALIEAFGLLPEDSTATVYTDSRLCVDTVESWAAGWEKRGWKREGGEIKNLDLVRPLYELRKTRPRAKLQWIAAHSGMRWNEYADSLATAWMRPADGAAHEDA